MLKSLGYDPLRAIASEAPFCDCSGPSGVVLRSFQCRFTVAEGFFNRLLGIRGQPDDAYRSGAGLDAANQQGAATRCRPNSASHKPQRIKLKSERHSFALPVLEVDPRTGRCPGEASETRLCRGWVCWAKGLLLDR